MNKSFLIALTGLFFSVSAFSQSKAKGYVFNDQNSNSTKDSNEKGIGGIAVTNGAEVVLTDKTGYYELPVGNDNIISVIKPTGYQVPKNSDNLPQFFFIHKPAGSPRILKYRGVSPTGPLPELINFPLTKSKEKDNYTALIFGDPQVYNEEQVDYFTRGVIKEVEGIKGVAFGLSMGDEVGDKLTLFPQYASAVKRVGIPWYNMVGNHDINMDVKADSLSDESFEAFFGPSSYAFNYGKTHFIVLNDVLYPDPRNGIGYFGGLRQDQFKFIENDLKFVPKDYLVVVTLHIPISEPGSLFRAEDRVKLFELLEDFPHTLSISAHTHMQRHDFYSSGNEWKQDKPHHHFNIGTASGDFYSGVFDKEGIPYSTMRDGTPKGYAFIHFKGNEYKIDYKVAGRDDKYQIDIYAPDSVKSGADSVRLVYANFFMGNKQSKVLYRVGSNEWKEMEYSFTPDPKYVASVAAWKKISDKKIRGRRPSNPARSTHLWKAKLPANLPVGEHLIEVKSQDMFGKACAGTGRIIVY
ncbi:calcineurin-like phosphoesterase C-terminal domain-containing protein [Desertivirga xinjiangensis]|uniref:calcineurin-like phosphoesterase C-terminal domain-containing protein n=1 Tax=Desertivirga xinjiangensis TaxID=539206 RepID=UPI00210BD20C|nr:calcineurin-like phosphoesterase family protein [Pedobacter xinjiangensis]